MSDRLVQLAANLEKVLGKRARSIETALGEVTVVVNADAYLPCYCVITHYLLLSN
jgi:NADH-quinone oxidoreductase subunit C